VLGESSTGSLLNLTGSAVVFVSAVADDFTQSIDGGSASTVYTAPQSINGGAA